MLPRDAGEVIPFYSVIECRWAGVRDVFISGNHATVSVRRNSPEK
jgi:hypothetical protein